ncbi:AfsR/SARP family transcriptional regulator [Nonomuraea sp. NPDC049625]|uniref:AfsR/SARP family transcriptional regulator n=1 Tax=Nonomuraea sp. NPDC049625 TaxID=3155775 RepID=UPI0034383580
MCHGEAIRPISEFLPDSASSWAHWRSACPAERSRFPASTFAGSWPCCCCHGGEPVAEGQLLSHVWGTSEVSLRALRTSVSRLRSCLRDHTGMTEAVKYTRSGGYVLDLDARHADAARFLGRYRAAAREPDPALGQWRGLVLEGAPEEVRTHTGIRRLQTAPAGCAARAADLALHTSRPEAALPHVREVAADMPYEEPLQTRLIRLLGATGRRAEALRCFEELRRRLADELGVDPSDELRATHAELLREHRPAPEPAAQTPPERARPVAAELPMDVATFTGRRPEVEHLCGLLGAARQEGPVDPMTESSLGANSPSAPAAPTTRGRGPHRDHRKRRPHPPRTPPTAPARPAHRARDRTDAHPHPAQTPPSPP